MSLTCNLLSIYLTCHFVYVAAAHSNGTCYMSFCSGGYVVNCILQKGVVESTGTGVAS
jgi:hypothetical protein